MAPGAIQKTLINGARGVLIPGSMAGDGHFTPTEEQARRFEAGLAAFLEKARPAEEPQLHRKLGGFLRQYTGGTNRGHRVLFVYFACRADPGWGARFVVVKDGGSCYFEVEYDLEAGAYTHVTVHQDS